MLTIAGYLLVAACGSSSQSSVDALASASKPLASIMASLGANQIGVIASPHPGEKEYLIIVSGSNDAKYQPGELRRVVSATPAPTTPKLQVISAIYPELYIWVPLGGWNARKIPDAFVRALHSHTLAAMPLERQMQGVVGSTGVLDPGFEIVFTRTHVTGEIQHASTALSGDVKELESLLPIHHAEDQK